MRSSFEHAYQLLMSYFIEVRLVDPNLVFDTQLRVVRIRDSQGIFGVLVLPKKLINY
ncbi:hypothetical protein GIB67_000760 [Kingdonia uniflora]|uniref:Uncharacterized protein n=1 Tax=Kingdonia uniflora TaxID=39325 RepID=A0A7J7NDD3_9MAGN|nr:hypothetical protein GIB67_000760 [Kingdonia uniflora]